MRQSIVAAGAGTAYDWSSDHIAVKTPLELTEGRVTVVEDTLKPGFNLPRHQHRAMTEVFYVVDGAAEFAFDDEQVVATPGMTVTVPPMVWHACRSAAGARLLTIFTPGGFDHYLAELAGLDEAALADSELVAALGERYDIWTR
jgi:quercetin dioxygenase-like cupin family protein